MLRCGVMRPVPGMRGRAAARAMRAAPRALLICANAIFRDVEPERTWLRALRQEVTTCSGGGSGINIASSIADTLGGLEAVPGVADVVGGGVVAAGEAAGPWGVPGGGAAVWASA